MTEIDSRPSPRQLAADLFFLLQLALALISGGSQLLRLLTTSQGVNASWLASWLAFLLINLTLVLHAHRRQPSRVTLQTVLTYAVWSLVIAADLGVMLWRELEVWNHLDTLTVALITSGLGVIAGTSRWRRLPLTDPLVFAGVGVCFIALPQLVLTYKILQQGGAGLAGAMLLAGHVGILTRLGQLGFALREAGWDRNRLGAALSELANEITWILVSLAWLWH